MIKIHSKEVVEKFKKHYTLENWQIQIKWKEIKLNENGIAIEDTVIFSKKLK